jgi:PAS domain S-box-containing protein
VKLPRISIKPAIFLLLRRLPMPVIAILIGLMAGLGVWLVLDQVQSKAVERIFGRELSMRLDLRSRESLLRFDQYMANYGATTRLLANHRRLAQYLEPLFWFPGEDIQPIVYDGFRPFWLPDFFGRNALLAPSHVLLVDSRGQVREIYQAGDEPLPADLSSNLAPEVDVPEEVQSVLARFGDRLFLVVSDRVDDAGGYTMGSLVVLVPVDAEFLAAAEGGFSADSSAVALVDADDQRILASNEPEQLIPGTVLSDWNDAYLVTSQSLPAYEGSNWNMLFATFIPEQSVAKMSGKVVEFERTQRLIAALVFIGVFTLVIYLVSARLNKVLKRMTRFSQRALGIDQPGFKGDGNQLVLLEEWMQHFTSLVLRAREEMRREHEHEMRETEALKAAIMEASLDSIVTLNRAGAVIDYNPTAQQTLGLDRATIIGTDFVRCHIVPGDRAIFVGMLQQSNRRGMPGQRPHARTELRALGSGGHVIPIEVSIVPIELDDERVYTLYIHDITKRKEAEREIKGLARFASESPSPILRVTGEARIVYANAASRPLIEAWGTKPGEALPERWCGEVQRTLEDGATYEQDEDLGNTIYSLLFVPIQDLGYVNIYARDITAVRRAEQESRQHQAELVHVCRLSTMGEVATGMAHELNQPLSAIVNYANGASRRLKSGSGDNEMLVDAMSHISGQAQRAGEIIKRLRALVGKQQPIRSTVDLNHLVREVCSFVEFETAKLEMQIEQRLSEEPIPVDVDLVQIEQVLLNLVRNALDALEERPTGERSLVITTWRAEQLARVSVRDNGPGIPPERMSQLFDPFFTTKETGMGMGLPISLTILEDHQGTIRAESEPDVGTQFSIDLPIAAEAAEQAELLDPAPSDGAESFSTPPARPLAEGTHG